eukprot:c18255_g1_i1 orf=1575-3614(-)
MDYPSPRLARVTYPSLLRLCGSMKALSTGKQIHDHIVRNGHEKKSFVSNLVLQMYCECGSMKDARKVFVAMRKRDLFSWNFMIKACSRLGLGKEALRLFAEMQREALIPDHFIWASVVSACASQVANMEGKRLHACVAGSGTELDCVLGTAFITLYGKCGCLDEAQRAFNGMKEHDLVAWTSLIGVHLQEGKVGGALKLYDQMQREGIMPDRFLVTSILAACASQGSIDEGKEMHMNIRRSGFESDVIIGNALIDMYGKCSSVEDAEGVFRNIVKKNVVSWNALFVAFTENGKGVRALELFERMQQEGVKPDAITYVNVFSLCASLGAMTKGKMIHEGIMGTELESDIDVRASIINMYGRLCNEQDALNMFNKSPKQYVSLWNAFLAAHAHSGRGKDAIQLFRRMQSEGTLPNKFTFVCLLYACGRAGLVDEVHGFFESMTQDYGISPTLEHFNCMVYILGRAGRLSEAMNFIGKMVVEPDIESWLILLGACRNHVDVKRGRCVANHLFELIPNHAAPQVMLFHLYLAAEREADARDLLKIMRDNKELKMTRGSSSIEVEGSLHIFSADDQLHPRREEIYAELSKLNAQVAGLGFNVSGHALQETLEGKHHDEKIAVTFGLITTAPKTHVLVTKNLRMCLECHTVLKRFSQVTDREIVVRDADCFHGMKDGVCSCADYW